MTVPGDVLSSWDNFMIHYSPFLFDFAYMGLKRERRISTFLEVYTIGDISQGSTKCF